MPGLNSPLPQTLQRGDGRHGRRSRFGEGRVRRLQDKRILARPDELGDPPKPPPLATPATRVPLPPLRDALPAARGARLWVRRNPAPAILPIAFRTWLLG